MTPTSLVPALADQATPAALCEIGTLAPDAQLIDHDGARVALSSVWRERPTLLFFLRHVGCAVCRTQLFGIRDAYAQIVALGGSALAIAPYEYVTAQRFLRSYQLPFPVLADESRASYHRFGLTEGTFRDSFGLDVLVQQAKETLRGNMAYVVPGHPVQQLGGSFIVDRSGIVRLAHIARPIYMYPPMATYLAVFQELSQGVPGSEQ